MTSHQPEDESKTGALSKTSIELLLINLINLIENVGKFASVPSVCEHLLRTLHIVILFLDDVQLSGMPLVIASSISYFPPSVHISVIELLCSVVIPLVYSKQCQESFAIDSIPSILTTVFQHVESAECHSWLIESLLSRKRELYKDLLMVIAYGPTEARLPAVCHLFHYWPDLCPSAFQSCDALKPKHYTWEPWRPVTCERTDCPNKAGKTFAMKMTTDAQISVRHGNKPPPFYVCLDCADALNRRDFDQLTDILLPSRQISSVCESKTCRSKNNTGVITCFSVECAFLNGNRPIRFCETCHLIRHSSQLAAPDGHCTSASESSGNDHIYQTQIPDVWSSSLDLQPCMLESIIVLSRESNPRWRQLLLGPSEDGRTAGGSAGNSLGGQSTPAAPAGPGGPQMPPEFLTAGAIGAAAQVLGTAPSVLSGQSPQYLPSQQGGQETTNMTGRTDATGNLRVNYSNLGRFVVGPNGEPELALEGRYDDEDHKVLAIYGALLAGEKCRPTEKTNTDLLTRVTAGIFNWFLDTVYTTEATTFYPGQGTLKRHYELGDLIERVKSEYIMKWVQEVQRTHLEVILAVLLPHPVEVARVGSCWDTLCGKTAVVKHGLSRIGSLIPYDIMTFETWDYIIPYWLEAIRTEVKPDDYRELEIILKKIFDATAGPFPFLPSKVYHFATDRFVDASVAVQDQVLSWLEILTAVDVSIPMKELLTMFRYGTAAFAKNNKFYEYVSTVDHRDTNHCESDSEDLTYSDCASLGSECLDCCFDEEDEQDSIEGSGSDGESQHRVLHEKTGRGDDDLLNEEREEDYAEYADDESTGLLASDGQCIKKNAIRFFLSEKKSTKQATNVEEKPKVAEDSYALREVVPYREKKRARNTKRQSRRYSVRQDGNRRISPRHKKIILYRATRCLGQMLDLIVKQLRLCDPFGHTGFTQETPQLVLCLLTDMLQLRWTPSGLNSEASEQRLPDRQSLLSNKCLGHCTAPSPTVSPTSAPGVSGLAALMATTGASDSANCCLFCQDVCYWFEMASRLCQHLAPASPPALPRLDLTVEAVRAFNVKPDYPKWRKNLASNDAVKHVDVRALDEVASTSSSFSSLSASMEPCEADLLTFPPTLRLIYQLFRCLMGVKGCAGVAYSPQTGPDDSFRNIPTDEFSRVPADGASSSSTAAGDADYSAPVIPLSEDSFKGFQSHPPRDPVVLRNILECLTFLVRVGNVLQNVLNAAHRSAERPPQTAPSAPPLSQPPLGRSPRASGQASTGVTAAVSSLNVQASFVIYLIEHCLIPSMWNLLTVEHSHLASWVLPLLLQSLTVPGMPGVFLQLIEKECTDADWKVRFHAYEKIFCLLRQLDMAVLSGFFNGPASKTITFGRQPTTSAIGSAGSGVSSRAGRLAAKVGGFRGGHGALSGPTTATDGWVGGNRGTLAPLHPFILNAVAHVFCRLIGSLDDYNSVVAQRTAFHLSALDDNALMCCTHCLEHQFDTVAADRSLILQRMHQLSCALSNRQIFSWDFFIDRFGILSIEAQINEKSKPDIDSVSDLNNMNKRGDVFQQQFNRAVFAMAGSDCLPSIAGTRGNAAKNTKAADSCERGKGQVLHSKTSEGGQRTSEDGEQPAVDSTDDRSRTQPAEQRRPRPSVIKLTGFFPGSSGGTDFMDSANKFLSSLQIKLDEEGSDRGTLHQWVRLLLRFMATVDIDGSFQGGKNRRGAAGDELKNKKSLSKVQRHLALLLGYSDQAFNIPPYKLRNSTVFHAFISHVADVLDRNPPMGSCILHQTLVVLQVCASPQRYANDWQAPNFTLRLLEPHIRHHWLNTLLIILYKYEYNSPTGLLNMNSSGSGSQKMSGDLLSIGGDYPPSQLNTGGIAGTEHSGPGYVGMGSGRSGGFSPGHVQQFGVTNPSLVPGGSSSQWGNVSPGGTRGIVEYLIKIVLNTLETQVHVCKEKTDEDLLESPTVFIPRLREASGVSAEEKINRDMEVRSPIQEADDEVVMPGITISQETVSEGSDSESDSSEALPIHNTDVLSSSLRESLLTTDKTRNFYLFPSRNKAQNVCENNKRRGQVQYTKKCKDQDLVSGLRLMSPVMKKKSNRVLNDTLGDSSLSDTKSVSPESQNILLLPKTQQNVAPGTVSTEEKAIIPPTILDTGDRRHPCQASSTGGPFTLTADLKAEKTLEKPVTHRSESYEKSVELEACSLLKVNPGDVATELFAKPGLSRPQMPPKKQPHVNERPPLTRVSEIDYELLKADPLAGEEPTHPDSDANLNQRGPSGNSRRVSSLRRLRKNSGTPKMSTSMASVIATAALSTERCPWCQGVLESHDEATIGLGIACLATFVHREPSMAAPYLIDMLMVASRIATSTPYSWQKSLPHIIVQGNSASIARQFLRCTLYNLAPNGIFVQLFQTPIPDITMFQAIILVLVNFEEHMSVFYPITSILDNLNKRKTLPFETLNVILENLALYLENLPRLTEEPKWNHFVSSGWAEIMSPFETFFRKLSQLHPLPNNFMATFRSMTCLLRAPTSSTFKQGVTDAYASILRLIIEQCHFQLSQLIEICSLCNRTFKERAKSQLTKVVVDSLLNAIKFRVCLPDENLLKSLQLILMDSGGTLEPNQISEGITNIFNPQTFHLFSTGAAELMRPHIMDCLSILADVHTIHKVKQAQKMAAQPVGSDGYHSDGGGLHGPGSIGHNTGVGGLGYVATGAVGACASSGGIGSSGGGVTNSVGGSGPSHPTTNAPSLHEDTIGAHLKSGIAQFVALELSRNSSVKDEELLMLLSPGLVVDENVPATDVQRKSTKLPNISTKPQPSGSLSGGSFRSVGGAVGAGGGGGSFNTQRQSSRGSTILGLGSLQAPRTMTSSVGQLGSECERGSKLDESSSTSASKVGVGEQSSPLVTPGVPKLNSGNTGHISLAVPSLVTRSPSIASVLATPGAGQQALMSIGHFALMPTLTHTTRIDAPILQYLPWLKSIPSAVQQGPRDFLQCVERVRTLTWLLLGATMHTALTRDATGLTCKPIPFIFVTSVADLVKFIISGFPEQKKQQSVAVMSSLYHAFLLCQVWTVYCEALGSLHSTTTPAYKAANATAMEFWIKIMPTIIHLLSISDDLVAINGHLLTVLEELRECRSVIVDKLISLWIPILTGKQRQLTGNMLKRLQKCIEWKPPEPEGRIHALINSATSLTNSGTSGLNRLPRKPVPLFAYAGNVDVNACSANALNGCNHLEGACAGHSLSPGLHSSFNGIESPPVNVTFAEGCGCNGIGNSGFLSTRLVRWLRKQIFVLGRNEDQHSTASHIFIH
ncbi:hypothetical protein AAHC03_0811 [Spirometra sp. Aus1]